MRHRDRWVGGASALVIVLAIAGCGGTGEASGAAAEQPAARTRVVNVETLDLETQSFAEQITVTGMVEPDRDVTVKSEESGVIREVFVQKGARLAAGEPIARIDDQLLRAQHEQAVSEATLAKETFERQRRLWEDEQIGTELAYLQAKYGAETADANARLLAARLERTVIRAPIAGYLEDRHVEVGTMVDPGADVARIIDADPLKVIAGVPERYAGQIQTGAQAMVGLEAAGMGVITGRVRFVGTAVDPRNRTFPVEVDVSNRTGMLKPGVIARVQLAKGAAEQAIVVPRDAVLRSATGYIVYVVEEQDGETIARARNVATGPGDGGRVQITSGLGAGDRVVVVGQQQLAEGDRVRITSAVEGGER